MYIPPPLTTTVFPANVHPVTAGLLLKFHIPPPPEAEFPLNVQSVTVGLLFDWLYIPPPRPLWLAARGESLLDSCGIVSGGF